MQLLALIGFILPPAIESINAWIPDTNARFWVSVLFCMGIAAFIEWGLTGTVTSEGLSTRALSIFGEAQITYHGLGYKDSKMQNFLRGEANTRELSESDRISSGTQDVTVVDTDLFEK